MMKKWQIGAWAMILSLASSVYADDNQANQTKKAKTLPPAKAADSDAPLAVGWPGGTDPGKIEIKRYPAYRSAVAKTQSVGLNGLADGLLFWPLFNHIESNQIAMTTPVVNTYTPSLIETPGSKGEITMEFIYRSMELGQAGKESGVVKVVDHPASTFVCLGVQGQMPNKDLVAGVKTLKAWLAEHKNEWVEAGPPRRLGYHGPMTPNSQKLWEVQIPVKPVPEKSQKNKETQKPDAPVSPKTDSIK